MCVNHLSCTLSVLFSFHLVSGLSWLLLKILFPLLRDCQIKPVKRNQVTVYFYEYRLCIINSGFTSMQIKSSYDSDYMHFLSNMAYISQITFNLQSCCNFEYLTRSYKVCHQILVNRFTNPEETRYSAFFSCILVRSCEKAFPAIGDNINASLLCCLETKVHLFSRNLEIL